MVNRVLNLLVLSTLLVPLGLIRTVFPQETQVAAESSPATPIQAGMPAQGASTRISPDLAVAGQVPSFSLSKSPAGSFSAPLAPVSTREIMNALPAVLPDSALATLKEQDLSKYLDPAALDLQDNSNDQALACIITLTAIFSASFGASFVPGIGELADYAAWAADLTLKYCIPYLQTSGNDIVLQPIGKACYADYNLPINDTSPSSNELEGEYKNFLGFPLTPAGFGVDWGNLIQPPEVVHYNSNVQVKLEYPGQRIDNQTVRLGVGEHELVWKGDTLIGLLDKVYISLPSPGYSKEELKEMSRSEFFKEFLIEVLKHLSQEGATYGFNDLLGEYPHGTENLQRQTMTVLDLYPPQLNVGANEVTVEATEPGGISRLAFLPALQRNVSATDNCDTHVQITASGLPTFVPVDSTYTVTWHAFDHGPNANFERNETTAQQVIHVVDTKPPEIVPPPSIVTETVNLPAHLSLGQPQVFDLVDMNPQVSNDAPAQFPAGVTKVHWWATDQSGNQSKKVTQVVNVKPLNTNHAPVGEGRTGANAYQAISYEPITITIQASDPDSDPLWFNVADEPQHGVLVSPLLPYFIEDYRVESHETFQQVQTEHCQSSNEHFQYPTPWDASYVAVSDQGETFVVDKGSMYCQFGSLETFGRIAIFDKHGSLKSTLEWDPAPQAIYIDQQAGILLVTDHDSGGNGVVVVYDLNLNQIGRYRTDYADVPPGENPLNQPTDAVVDRQGILYVTDTNVIRAYKTETVPGGLADQPVLLGSILKFSPNWIESLAVDSHNNLYASLRDSDRIYKFSASMFDQDGTFHPGQLIGWMGKCDTNLVADGDLHCDEANHRSFGFSCTDTTCGVVNAPNPDPNFCQPSQVSGQCTPGSKPGQFDEPLGIAVDPNDVLYVTDYNNFRVQRFSPDGLFAGQAVSTCDGTCFILGDFGRPRDITVNSSHFYILNRDTNLLHVSQTTPIKPLSDSTAQVVYRSNNNWVQPDSFSFTASDGLATSAPAVVEFDVSRNHRAPTALAGLAFKTDEDTPASVTLGGNDPDGSLDTLSFAISSPPEHGSLSGSGAQRTYTPASNYNGPDVFAYTVSDGLFTSQPVTVGLTINPVNDPPVLSMVSDMDFGLGFDTVYTATFSDPDLPPTHTLTLDWGDGVVETQGEIQADGTVTGPLLIEDGLGQGTIRAMHSYTSPGNYTIRLCVQDMDGAKSCGNTTAHVRAMTQLHMEVLPSANPLAQGQGLSYMLKVANQAPDASSGVLANDLVVTSTVGTYLTLKGSTPSQGSCSLVSGINLRCNLGSLAVGSEANIDVQVQVSSDAGAGSVLEVQATAQGSAEDTGGDQYGESRIEIVHPGDFLVNSLMDQGDQTPGDGVCADQNGLCTLRAAVDEANALPGQQIISLSAQTYQLGAPAQALRYMVTRMAAHAPQMALPAAGSALNISDDLIIQGLGASRSVISGQQLDRVLIVQAGKTVRLRDLAITGGMTDGNGGGVMNSGDLTLDDTIVSNNQSASGAGVYSAGGKLTIIASLITGNNAGGDGGGVYVATGTANLTNTTLSSNQAAGSGGGLFTSGETRLTYVTLAKNRADQGGGLQSSGGVTMLDSLLAENTASSGPDCSGNVASSGHNLVQDSTGCGIGSGSADLLDIDARLGPLGQYGGDTLVHSLSGNSPAIDAATCAAPLDQRGVSRPQGPGCDIGAFEYEPPQLFLPLVLRH